MSKTIIKIININIMLKTVKQKPAVKVKNKKKKNTYIGIIK